MRRRHLREDVGKKKGAFWSQTCLFSSCGALKKISCMTTFTPPCRKFDCDAESMVESLEQVTSPVVEKTFRWYY
jgi:hypothetical protein